MAKFDRRSFLRRVGAVSGLGALGAILGTRQAGALQRSDNDLGRYADPRNMPQRVYDRRTGVSDTDSGSHADRAGYGRRRPEPTGFTDRDSGSSADRSGYGVPRTGHTDSDSGRYADPSGRGRRGPPPRTGISDSDSGRCADRSGYGRGGQRAGCPDD